MRRPAAGPNDKLKAFTVAPGVSIGDNNNVRKNGEFVIDGKPADTIMLTQKQAQFHMERRHIIIEVPEFDDEPVADKAETKSGTEADGAGKPSMGKPPAPVVAKTTKSSL